MNTGNTYVPAPIDTTDIDLPEEILALAEELAKNTHEVWAQGRVNAGWNYGEQRNDELKKHPCLVAYEELTESEKEYDRSTAIETLKLIIKLGYKISQK